jgi:hypothetical protein
VVSASAKAVLALDDADPTFDTSMEASASPEPALTFVLTAGFRLTPRLGQDDSFDAQLGGKGFIISRVNTTVGARLPRGSAELLHMSFQHGLPLRFIGGVTI